MSVTHTSPVDIQSKLTVDDLLVRNGVPHGTASFDAAGLRLATKSIHQYAVSYSQSIGAPTDLAAETGMPIHICKSAATLIEFNVMPLTAPLTTRVYTVDLMKSTAGGAFATVLTTEVLLNSSSVDLTVQAGSLATTTAIADDAYQIVIVETVGTGTACKGVICTMILREEP